MFRDHVIYKRPVELVIDANKRGIKKLFQAFSKNTTRMSMNDAIALMTTETHLKLTYYNAMYCYAFSLQSCVDLHKSLKKRMLHITLIEFMEMICRFADMVIRAEEDEPEIPLANKIEEVLMVWLSLVGKKKQKPKLFHEESSSEDELMTMVTQHEKNDDADFDL